MNNKKAIQDATSRYTSFPIGLTRECIIDSAEVVKSEKTNRLYGKFRFVQPELKYGISKFIFIPDYNQVKPKEGESKQDALNRVQDAFMSDLTTILLGFGVEAEQAEINAVDEAAFLKAAVDKINKLVVDKKLKCDLVVQMDRNDEYTELPKYGYIAPFVEGKPSSLESKARAIVQAAAPAIKPSTASIFDDEGDVGSDDLPF